MIKQIIIGFLMLTCIIACKTTKLVVLNDEKSLKIANKATTDVIIPSNALREITKENGKIIVTFYNKEPYFYYAKVYIDEKTEKVLRVLVR